MSDSSKLNFKDFIKPGAIAGTLAVLTVLVGIGKGLFEGLLKDWVSECSIVIETEFLPNKLAANQALVEIYSFGDLPPSMQIDFLSDKQVIKEVILQSSLRKHNRATHPLDRKRCPENGKHCGSKVGNSDEGRYNRLSFSVTDLSPNYHYYFIVNLFNAYKIEDYGEDQIKLGNEIEGPVRFQSLISFQESEKNICSVESSNPSNWFIRMSLSWQIVWSAIFLLALTILVTIFTRSK